MSTINHIHIPTLIKWDDYIVFRMVMHFFNECQEKWLFMKVIVWGVIKSEITINHVKSFINPMHSLLLE